MYAFSDGCLCELTGGGYLCVSDLKYDSRATTINGDGEVGGESTTKCTDNWVIIHRTGVLLSFKK